MPYVEPVKAAAGIILTNGPHPRVLLARRSAALRFMAGHHVFPGGRIDDEEPTAAVTGALDTADARAVHAVAREIFEETGLLLASGALPEKETMRTARAAILDRRDTFDAFLARHGLTIDAARFLPAGDWVTPAAAPIRFDTRYFICRVPAAVDEELCIGEIDVLDWFTPAGARKAWRAGKIRLSPPVAYVLQHLAAYPFPGVIDHLRSCGGHTGERPSKMEFANGIYMLPLRSPTLPPATHTNCVIIGERDLYIIDPAACDDEERRFLTRQVKMLTDLGGAVKAIILTHSHTDHVCAAEFCRETYNVPIWAHAETARQLQRSAGVPPAVPSILPNPHATPNPTARYTPDAKRSPVAVARHLTNGDIITIPGDPDWRLRILHTPGHDPGHLCFIEETARTLIGGDIIANPGTIVVSLDMGGDMTQFIESLQRLVHDPGYDTILPGHGMPLTKGPEQIQKHLDHRLWREQKIKDALARGVKSVQELLPLAYDDVPPETWPLAELSLRAHLKRLELEL